MSEPGAKLADHLDVVKAHLVDVSARLKAGDVSGIELHGFGDLLTALAEAVHLYADKLNDPPAISGRHAPKERPADPTVDDPAPAS